MSRSYSLRIGTVEGDKIRYEDVSKLYEVGETQPFATGYNSINIPSNKASGAGTWYLEVYREGNLIVSGNYNYDFAPAQVLTTDIGLEVIPYTKEELLSMFLSNGSAEFPYVYGYKVYVDTAKIKAAFPLAKYAMTGTENMVGPTSSLAEGLTLEEFKTGTQPNGYSGFPMAYTTHIFSNPLAAKQQLPGGVHVRNTSDFTPVVDMFVFVGLYDENFTFLGQYISVAQFDQDHVTQGYTPAGNWNPVIN